MKSLNLRAVGIFVILALLLPLASQTTSAGSTDVYWVYLPLVKKGMQMVFVPAGDFQRGCDPDHNGGVPCPADELPLRTIYLNAFYIDRYEVTNAEYAMCVTAGFCTAPKNLSSISRSSYYDNPTYANYPVVWIHLVQAVDYCNWRGNRLPTEAEWEKAARGASDTRAYPWGDGAPSCALANSWNDAGSNTCLGDTNQVGSYPAGASVYGALDMAGNVWEWVSDQYDPNYYSIAPSSNPTGPDWSIDADNVLRGGSFYEGWSSLRVAKRSHLGGGNCLNWNGFRCAAWP